MKSLREWALQSDTATKKNWKDILKIFTSAKK